RRSLGRGGRSSAARTACGVRKPGSAWKSALFAWSVRVWQPTGQRTCDESLRGGCACASPPRVRPVGSVALGRGGSVGPAGRRAMRVRPPRLPRRGSGRGSRLGGWRRSLEDLGGAVAVLQTYLVRACWSAGAVVQIVEEVAVDLQSAVRAAVHAQEP